MLKIALITTTIGIPSALAAFRAVRDDVMFFIAGDRKTPDEQVANFLVDIPNHAYYGIDRQHQLGYACSQLIGDNCIQRRNVALLEAVRWGAEIIISWDDDNLLVEPHYFNWFEDAISHPFIGLSAVGGDGWFDVGQLLDPKSPHRGMPLDRGRQPVFAPIVNAKVGVAAGVCLGDPDVSAYTRIAKAPIVHQVSELLRSGLTVDPAQTWTVFNSQNSAIVRELAPAWFMLPFVGRMDDIYASLIMQRVMRERGLHVHFGQPFCWQSRNQHNLVNDLRGEIDGMENVFKLAGVLDHMDRFAVDKPILRQIWERISQLDWMPKRTSEAAFAFLDDMEKVL